MLLVLKILVTSKCLGIYGVNEMCYSFTQIYQKLVKNICILLSINIKEVKLFW